MISKKDKDEENMPAYITVKQEREKLRSTQRKRET
jgi:hypothetical protein